MRAAFVTDWSFVPLFHPHCCDAVTVRYRTILHRTEADFHRSIFLPSQAPYHYQPDFINL